MSCNGCKLNTGNNRGEMLNTYEWLKDIPDTSHLSKIVEVSFKGTRKEFFLNENHLSLKTGEKVVVSCSPGHDVGQVMLTGTLAKKQFERKIRNPEIYKWKKIYRKATELDIGKWENAQKREYPVMVRSRQIAAELGLEMKIGDVEFQGDGRKAIFYYIADGRVDFRQLIKRYASEFQIKVEMKQIGARQEAGRVGSIGSCGRELCCSSWRTNLVSVTSEAATRQGLSPNAEKLSGQCGKLKCCLLYELDSYLEAQEDFPTELLDLETDKGIARHLKTEILSKKIWYSIESSSESKPVLLDLDDVKEIIQLNKRGEKPSLKQYLSGEPEHINEMNVGTVNLDIMNKKKSNFKKRNTKSRRNNRTKTKKHIN